MGIHGIYKEIGPGERIALSKLAIEKFEDTGRPLRIAIDTSIWLFQIQSSKGGTNPALRTFYYRLLRLISLSIHPLFVFDGPNKPPFKRNKRTGPNVASIPEFLAKQLLKQFGFPFHIAPGEAEAECALLQREGIVDVVLSEDVDTLMFGSRITLRNWSPEQKSSKVPTHVNVYDAGKTKSGPSGLDREGMILVALMSGGDYLPEGIPGCGPKTACEAARAGFGHRLCAIKKKDTAALQAWREDLARELRTNESKFFKRKHGTLSVPEDFPRADILGYYVSPAISSPEALERLKRNLRWDQDLNFAGLRTFTADAFEWVKVTGAKKFIRNLAPALLVRHLRMRGQAAAEGRLSEDPDVIEAEEGKLVTSIHGTRQHPSTDNTPELRVAFSPIDIVNIDLDAEEPDDEPSEDEDEEEEMALAGNCDGEAPKKRGPYLYDPTHLDKIWIFETLVKIGAPLTVQDWEEKQRRKTAPKPAKVTKPRAPKKTTGGMQKGAMDSFTRITKANAGLPLAKRRSPSIDRVDLSRTSEGLELELGEAPMASSSRATFKTSSRPDSHSVVMKAPVIIDILSSPETPCQGSHLPAEKLDEHYRSPNITKRIRTLRRSQTSPGNCADALPSQHGHVSCTSQTSPMAGDLFTSTTLGSTGESTSSHQPILNAQKAARTTNSSRDTKPSTPSRRRQQQQKKKKKKKKTEDVSPSKRQMTLQESLGLSKSNNASSEGRHASFLGMHRRATPGAEEVEELDLSHSSPNVPEDWGSNTWRHSNMEPEPSSQVRGLSEAVRNSQAHEKSRHPGGGSLQISSGNRGTRPANTGMKRGVKGAPSITAARSTRLGMSPGLRRSPRQHDGSQSNVVVQGTTDLRRSPRHHRTIVGGVEESAENNARLRASSDKDARSTGSVGTPAKRTAKKQVIRLRESLQGSWKLVDASSADVLDMTGDGRSQTSGGRQGRRRAWRQSEVEVLDLTNG